MSIGSLVEMYCTTAKKSMFTKAGSAARVVKRLVMTCPVTSYRRTSSSYPWKKELTVKSLACDCDAVCANGAWYLTALINPSTPEREAYLLLVLPDDPDNSIGFNEWRTNGTTFDAALTAIEDYNTNHGLHGWDGIVTWFDEQLGELKEFLPVLDVEMFDQQGGRYGKQDVQEYNNEGSLLSVWLSWLHSCMTTEAQNSAMSNWYDSSTNNYIVTAVFSFQGFTMTVDIKLAI